MCPDLGPQKNYERRRGKMKNYDIDHERKNKNKLLNYS
jgi:hypothetical protein